MTTKKFLAIVAVFLVFSLCTVYADEEDDEKARLPAEVIDSLNLMEDAINTFEDQMASVNNTDLDDPTAAVAEATQKSRATEVFLKCLKYLRAFYRGLLYIYRYLMVKLLGNKLMKTLTPCRHEEKFIATPLVDATTGCGAKYVIGDDHIVVKMVENQRTFCKYIKTLPSEFMMCKKQVNKVIKIGCFVKMAIEVIFKASVFILIFWADMTSLMTTASLNQLSSLGKIAQTGKGLTKNVRECIAPQAKSLNDKCKEHKLKEAQRKKKITDEIDFEEDIDQLILKHLPDEITKYEEMTGKSIDEELMKKLGALMDDIPFVDEDE